MSIPVVVAQRATVAQGAASPKPAPLQQRFGTSAMPDKRPSGTEGYADEAEALLRQYECIAFTSVHQYAMRLMPQPPAHVLNIGAGTGRDAAGFAALEYSVVAVEPTAELRLRAMQLHPSPCIEWIDDFLPDLRIVSARDQTFELAMMTAVWMHLDARQRRHGMPRVAALLRPGGMMMLTVRHGPVPPGRRMFDVTPEETIELAQNAGLSCVQTWQRADSQLQRPGVTWDRLAFTKPLPAR